MHPGGPTANKREQGEANKTMETPTDGPFTRGGFTEGHLRRMLRKYRPAAYDEVCGWAPETQRDFYDRLGRAYAAALERALRYGKASGAANKTT